MCILKIKKLKKRKWKGKARDYQLNTHKIHHFTITFIPFNNIFIILQLKFPVTQDNYLLLSLLPKTQPNTINSRNTTQPCSYVPHHISQPNQQKTNATSSNQPQHLIEILIRNSCPWSSKTDPNLESTFNTLS